MTSKVNQDEEKKQVLDVNRVFRVERKQVNCHDPSTRGECSSSLFSITSIIGGPCETLYVLKICLYTIKMG